MKNTILALLVSTFISSTAFADDGTHMMQIQTNWNTAGSISVVGTDFFQIARDGVCYSLSNRHLKNNQWIMLNLQLANGTNYTVNSFSSRNCTTGLINQAKGVVPDRNGLTYMWIKF